MQMKVCSKCRINKPFSEYFKDNIRKIGIRCKCKVCCKADTMEWRGRHNSDYNSYMAMWRAKNPGRTYATHIKRRYGFAKSDYEAMLLEQQNQCKICGKLGNPSKAREKLFVDHCHKTKKVRGLLCRGCNSAIGHMNDNVDWLYKAISYLKSHQ